MRTLRRLPALAALLVLAAACGKKDEPTEPTEGLTAGAFEAAQSELSSLASAVPTRTDVDPSTAPTPLLARLVRISLERLTIAGREEMKEAAISALRERHAALAEAIASGDREAVLRAKNALDHTSARLAVAVLSPRIVPEVVQMVGRQVRALNERIDAAEADGRDVAGPRRVIARVVAMLGESRVAFTAGNHVQALVIAARAADVLQTAFHR